jgi:hypothetical protein
VLVRGVRQWQGISTTKVALRQAGDQGSLSGGACTQPPISSTCATAMPRAPPQPGPLLAAHHFEDASGDRVQHGVHSSDGPEDAHSRPLLGTLLEGREAAAEANEQRGLGGRAGQCWRGRW